MSLIPDFNDEVFKSKNIPAPQVNVDVPSILRVMEGFIKSELHEAKQFKADLAHARYDWERQDLELMIRNNQHCIQNLKNKWGTKDTQDKSITALHAIEGLQRIWGEEHPRVPFEIGPTPYIIAHTDTVEFEHNRSTIDLGEYLIMLPLGGEIIDMHWVPVRDPKTQARHPHHRGGERGAFNTCLGSFSGYVASSLAMGDIVSLLRFMSRYIHIYNPGSPLVHLHAISHRIVK